MDSETFRIFKTTLLVGHFGFFGDLVETVFNFQKNDPSAETIQVVFFTFFTFFAFFRVFRFLGQLVQPATSHVALGVQPDCVFFGRFFSVFLASRALPLAKFRRRRRRYRIAVIE